LGKQKFFGSFFQKERLAYKPGYVCLRMLAVALLAEGLGYRAGG
jgi:hypothetical protein